MKDKILIVGAASLEDGKMLIHAGVPPTCLKVTELRTYEQLTVEYGQNFIENYAELSGLGVEIQFSVDATNMAFELIRDVKFILWNCPHFGNACFHEMLEKFFHCIDKHFTNGDDEIPIIGIGLDCLGPDGLYNLTTRFDINNISGWYANQLVDMQSFYQFTPTSPREAGRKELTTTISDFILMLVFTKKMNPKLHEKTNQSFWIPLDNSDDNREKISPETSLSLIKRTESQNWLQYLQKLIEVYSIVQGKSEYQNILKEFFKLIFAILADINNYPITNFLKSLEIFYNSLNKTNNAEPSLHLDFEEPTVDTIQYYVNLHKLPVIHLPNFISILFQTDVIELHERFNADSTPYFYLNKERTRYMNCLSNPQEKHPVRPTHVLKQIEGTSIESFSWHTIWKETKGGILPLKTKSIVPNLNL